MYQMIDWFIDWLIYFSQEHTGGGGGGGGGGVTIFP